MPEEITVYKLGRSLAGHPYGDGCSSLMLLPGQATFTIYWKDKPVTPPFPAFAFESLSSVFRFRPYSEWGFDYVLWEAKAIPITGRSPLTVPKYYASECFTRFWQAWLTHDSIDTAMPLQSMPFGTVLCERIILLRRFYPDEIKKAEAVYRTRGAF